MRRLLQRLQCSIGSSLSWINHNQVNAKSYILTYIYMYRKRQRISWMNSLFLLCHIILENQKTGSSVFLWRTVLRSFRKVREKSDKFVRHFQGQPFRSPYRERPDAIMLSAQSILPDLVVNYRHQVFQTYFYIFINNLILFLIIKDWIRYGIDCLRSFFFCIKLTFGKLI